MAMYKMVVVSYKLVCVTSYMHAHAKWMSAACESSLNVLKTELTNDSCV